MYGLKAWDGFFYSHSFLQASSVNTNFLAIFISTFDIDNDLKTLLEGGLV
jgi:hypothetical protein